jgi:protein associated with RNAse G/E
VIDTNTGDVTEYQEHQRAFGYGEIIDRLCKAGFKSVEAYRDFDGTPARAEEFSVFVCRK